MKQSDKIPSAMLDTINSHTTEPHFSPESFPKRLNLGCGFDYRQSYLNIDLQEFHSPDMVGDVTNLHMLPSEYYEEIIAKDVLEHIRRDLTKSTMEEWNRLLVTGGILDITTSNVLGVAKLLNSYESWDIEAQQCMIHCLFGTQAYTGDYHLTSFTPSLLRFYFEQAGFKIIEMLPKDEWLLRVTATKVSKPLIPNSADANKPIVLIKGQRILFNKLADGFLFGGLSGWSKAESWGTWSCGSQASLTLSLEEPENITHICIEAIPFVDSSHPEQQIQIKINEVDVSMFVLHNYSKAYLDIKIPEQARKHLNRVEPLKLHFNFPNAISPKALGIGEDERILSLGLVAVTAL